MASASSEPHVWRCKTCEAENKPRGDHTRTHCELCGTVRPARSHALAEDEDDEQPFRWSCKACLYENELDSEDVSGEPKCKICGAPVSFEGLSPEDVKASLDEMELDCEQAKVDYPEKALADARHRITEQRIHASCRITPGTWAWFCGLGCLLFIVVAAVLAVSFAVIDYTEFGLRVSTRSGAITEEESETAGRYWTGPTTDFVRFPRTIQRIEFVGIKYATGGGVALDSLGATAGSVAGPVVVRTSDGQIVEVELIIMYQLNPNTIFDLFTRYGLAYHDFLTAMARSRIRDVAASYEASEFWANREHLEQAIRVMMREELGARKVKLVDLLMLDLGLPTELDNILLYIQTQDLLALHATQVVITTNITEQTSTMVQKLVSQRDREISALTQGTINLQLPVEFRARVLRERTIMEVAEINANNSRDVVEYTTYTNNAYLALEKAVIETAGNTSVDVATLQAETDIINAQSNLEASRIRETATAYYVETYAAAQAFALEERARKQASVHSAWLTSFPGLDKDTFVSLEWPKAVDGMRNADTKFDIEIPDGLSTPYEREMRSHKLAP
jgi:hypothetical protein